MFWDQRKVTELCMRSSESPEAARQLHPLTLNVVERPKSKGGLGNGTVRMTGRGRTGVCAGAGRAARGGSGSGFVAGSYKGKTGIVQKLTPQKAHVALLDVLYVTHDTLDLRWA